MSRVCAASVGAAPAAAELNNTIRMSRRFAVMRSRFASDIRKHRFQRSVNSEELFGSGVGLDPGTARYIEFVVHRILGIDVASQTRDRLRGTLDLLVLQTLTAGPRHGYAIARWLADESADTVRVEEGSLYPALYRLEERGLVSSEWRSSGGGRPAKFYKLTPQGKKQLAEEQATWRLFMTAVEQVLAI